ncbi:siphovirus ReqiPepy6 Gp37-like family protein [Cytobacillus spongiae]|uniref:siphovirus ReqiPepy6 Gp37-like family protein n=1 Tax=Cytobacillus spongiae TaxID=2901381 RepID=UPI001F260A74|nr:siphovirus ReqiPepy6 Gp37-like family protein [Cytobacillus spongiae]UII56717.1 siphovirus ReqiPepy6 Gp37-like family protein [Cytobacillus spongiae]
MNIFVFNTNFEMLGIIDTFISLIWRREFYKTGTFEFHLNLPEGVENDDETTFQLIQLLQKGHILVKEDSPEEAAYIENLILDEQENEILTVSGYFVDNIISIRTVLGDMNKSGSVEEVIKYFIDKNAVTPSDPNRVIPGLVLSPNIGISKLANEVNSYGNLAQLTEELALKYDTGWRVLFDLANKNYIFDVYEGRDLSVGQSENPRAIFSLEFENVHQQKFTDSDSGFRNVAIVAGQGEGADRKLVFINNNFGGFERKELFVDARDLSSSIQSEDGTQIILNDEEYEALLEERGKLKLAETQPIQTFDSGISVTSNLIYKQDFDLGDIVTVKNDRWGVLLNTRITTVEEVYENDTVDIRVNFGSNIPTLIDRIQQRMR